MPELHLLAGPNGAGKSSYAFRVLLPTLHLPFVNADQIAAERWPGAEVEHAYDAARLAAAERQRLLTMRRSFVTETVFSHQSKVDLVEDAARLGYLVHLHVVMVPPEIGVLRVAYRAQHGGHDVPEAKIRARYNRLWGLIAQARSRADRADFFDNSVADAPFRLVASYQWGKVAGIPDWPEWTPEALLHS